MCAFVMLTRICFCGCEVCVVCCRALSRLPLAASVTTEVIINSIYKIMYVQNRKFWRRGGNGDRL